MIKEHFSQKNRPEQIQQSQRSPKLNDVFAVVLNRLRSDWMHKLQSIIVKGEQPLESKIGLETFNGLKTNNTLSLRFLQNQFLLCLSSFTFDDDDRSVRQQMLEDKMKQTLDNQNEYAVRKDLDYELSSQFKQLQADMHIINVLIDAYRNQTNIDDITAHYQAQLGIQIQILEDFQLLQNKSKYCVPRRWLIEAQDAYVLTKAYEYIIRYIQVFVQEYQNDESQVPIFLNQAKDQVQIGLDTHETLCTNSRNSLFLEEQQCSSTNLVVNTVFPQTFDYVQADDVVDLKIRIDIVNNLNDILPDYNFSVHNNIPNSYSFELVAFGSKVSHDTASQIIVSTTIQNQLIEKISKLADVPYSRQILNQYDVEQPIMNDIVRGLYSQLVILNLMNTAPVNLSIFNQDLSFNGKCIIGRICKKPQTHNLVMEILKKLTVQKGGQFKQQQNQSTQARNISAQPQSHVKNSDQSYKDIMQRISLFNEFSTVTDYYLTIQQQYQGYELEQIEDSFQKQIAKISLAAQPHNNDSTGSTPDDIIKEHTEQLGKQMSELFDKQKEVISQKGPSKMPNQPIRQNMIESRLFRPGQKPKIDNHLSSNTEPQVVKKEGDYFEQYIQILIAEKLSNNQQIQNRQNLNNSTYNKAGYHKLQKDKSFNRFKKVNTQYSKDKKVQNQTIIRKKSPFKKSPRSTSVKSLSSRSSSKSWSRAKYKNSLNKNSQKKGSHVKPPQKAKEIKNSQSRSSSKKRPQSKKRSQSKQQQTKGRQRSQSVQHKSILKNSIGQSKEKKLHRFPRYRHSNKTPQQKGKKSIRFASSKQNRSKSNDSSKKNQSNKQAKLNKKKNKPKVSTKYSKTKNNDRIMMDYINSNDPDKKYPCKYKYNCVDIDCPYYHDNQQDIVIYLDLVDSRNSPLLKDVAYQINHFFLQKNVDEAQVQAIKTQIIKNSIQISYNQIHSRYFDKEFPTDLDESGNAKQVKFNVVIPGKELSVILSIRKSKDILTKQKTKPFSDKQIIGVKQIKTIHHNILYNNIKEMNVEFQQIVLRIIAGGISQQSTHSNYDLNITKQVKQIHTQKFVYHDLVKKQKGIGQTFYITYMDSYQKQKTNRYLHSDADFGMVEEMVNEFKKLIGIFPKVISLRSKGLYPNYDLLELVKAYAADPENLAPSSAPKIQHSQADLDINKFSSEQLIRIQYDSKQVDYLEDSHEKGQRSTSNVESLTRSSLQQIRFLNDQLQVDKITVPAIVQQTLVYLDLAGINPYTGQLGLYNTLVNKTSQYLFQLKQKNVDDRFIIKDAKSLYKIYSDCMLYKYGVQKFKKDLNEWFSNATTKKNSLDQAYLQSKGQKAYEQLQLSSNPNRIVVEANSQSI